MHCALCSWAAPSSVSFGLTALLPPSPPRGRRHWVGLTPLSTFHFDSPSSNTALRLRSPPRGVSRISSLLQQTYRNAIVVISSPRYADISMIRFPGWEAEAYWTLTSSTETQAFRSPFPDQGEGRITEYSHQKSSPCERGAASYTAVGTLSDRMFEWHSLPVQYFSGSAYTDCSLLRRNHPADTPPECIFHISDP